MARWQSCSIRKPELQLNEFSKADVRALIDRARRTGRVALDEASGKQILSAYGIRVPRSKTIAGPDEVATALRDLSFPCALKINSPDIIHKSDFGGVALNLTSESAVCEAIARMTAMARDQQRRVEGFIVEEMAPPGHAIVIGAYRDPSFGLLVMFGLGGVFVELLRDLSFRLCPIDSIDAREMIGELKGAPILAGARGGLAVSEHILVDAMMAIAGRGGLIESLADDFDEIDINPLIASASGAMAVDARFVLARRDNRDA